MRSETCLAFYQKMFNIYEMHRKNMIEEEKPQLQPVKFNHFGVSSNIEVIMVKVAKETKGTIPYVTVANHVVTVVSNLHENL